MLRPAFLSLGLLLFSSTAFGQTTSADSQTLQALLEEVHQLRKDVQMAATSARRAQILIHRLYVQEAAVERASQRVDEATSRLDQMESQKKYRLAEIKNDEDMRDNEQDATQRKRLDDSISYQRKQMEELALFEQEAQAKKIQLEEQWRIEQAKMEQLQDELDQLDRAVMNAALRQSPAHRAGAPLQSISARKLL